MSIPRDELCVIRRARVGIADGDDDMKLHLSIQAVDGIHEETVDIDTAATLAQTYTLDDFNALEGRLVICQREEGSDAISFKELSK